jgi:hypothetical protein
MLAHFVLWEAAGDRSQLEAAHRILDELIAGAPEVYRPGMLANVDLHRRINEAWQAYSSVALLNEAALPGGGG